MSLGTFFATDDAENGLNENIVETFLPVGCAVPTEPVHFRVDAIQEGVCVAAGDANHSGFVACWITT